MQPSDSYFIHASQVADGNKRFPVAMQVSKKHGIIHLIATKYGFIHLIIYRSVHLAVQAIGHWKILGSTRPISSLYHLCEGLCDDKLISITNDDSMFKQQA
jgi:hypothetical protein